MPPKYIADDPSETGWVQTGQNLLSRGWSVGKKVAIAGAAISVTPMVLPPLLVFTAFGIAVSVPFGVYYASMAGTERLMQSLLPLDQGQEVDESLEEEMGYLNERDLKYEENWDREGDDEIVEEGIGYVSRRDSKYKENGYGKDGGADDDVIMEKPSERDDATEEHREMNKDNVVVESLEGNGNVRKRDFETEKDEETNNNRVDVERVKDINSGTADKDFVTMEKSEIKLEDPKSTTLAQEGTGRTGAEATRTETGKPDVVEEKGMVTADTGKKGKKGRKGKKGSTAVSTSEDVSDTKVYSDLADAESRSSIEHVGEVKDVSAVASASAELPVTSETEEVYTEKELWDQLHALRTIVGYRAAIKKTVPAELGALYVFTGVELPSTARDASNLLDLNYKLQFLKSVIGVK